MSWITRRSAKYRALIDRYYPSPYFGGQAHVDGFYDALVAPLVAQRLVLDTGCGRWLQWPRTAAAARYVIGLDMLPEARHNLGVNAFAVAKADEMPLRDNSVDAVICRSVVEHLTKPTTFLNEAFRVLRSRGHLIILTPNRFGYAGIVSQLVPNRFHASLVQLVYGRDKEDTFPTLYRANTHRGLRRLCAAAGFREIRDEGLEPTPGFLVSLWLCRLMIGWERLVNSRPQLRNFRSQIFIVCVKP